MSRSRLAAIVSSVVLLLGAVPPDASAQVPSSVDVSAFRTWLNRRRPGDPFRYYGFLEACDKYLRTRILGEAPDPGDVTSVLDRSAETPLRADIARLEQKRQSAPFEIDERNRHIAAMKRERESIRAQLAETQRQIAGTERSLASDGGVHHNSQAWDDRNQAKLLDASLARRLTEIDSEINRTEMGRARLMQSHEIERQIDAKRAAITALETAKVRVYLVSYKPLLGLALGALLGLGGLANLASRLRSGWTSTGIACVLAVALAGALYVTLQVATLENLIPPAGLLSNPLAFAVGFAALFCARSAAERRVRGGSSTQCVAVAVGAVLALAAALVLSGRSGPASTALLTARILDSVWLAVWGFAALWILDWDRPGALKLAALAAVTVACVQVGTGTPWLGLLGSAKLLGAALGVSGAALAVAAAWGMPAPAGTPGQAEPDPPYQDGPQWA